MVQDDPHGLIGDMVRLGVIDTVDLAAASCIVAVGDVRSPPLPWLELAGGFRTWVPPTVGEQVLLICPEGDIAHGVALRGLYSDAFPAPAGDATARILMPDGTTIDYDPAAHRLTISLAGGGLTIDAPAGVTIVGDVDVTGTVTASDDVIGGGISLKTHRHGNVQSGSSQTGSPV